MDAQTIPEESKFTQTRIPDAVQNSTEKTPEVIMETMVETVAVAILQVTAIPIPDQFHLLKRAPLK